MGIYDILKIKINNGKGTYTSQSSVRSISIFIAYV